MNARNAVTILTSALMLLAASCAGANQPPTAYMDSITPSNPQAG
ncbi:MAG: hypothetical protein U9N44_00565 [Chloroflexota bacterium]|nr:hypothetical protein [Chloroflexota bacterium]